MSFLACVCHPRTGLWATLLVALLVAGCATNKADWSSRVGTYTLDQAILELGPPDKQAQLQDKSVVADWMLRRGYAYHYPAYTYWGSFYGPVYPGYYTDGYSPDSFLRL